MNQVKLGKFIRELRNELGMTQQELADKIEVSDKTISKWENARGMPDISLLIPLSNALNISVLELLNGERSKDLNMATIDLIKRSNRVVKIWKWLFMGVINVLLIFILLFIIYGYIIPTKYANSKTQGITEILSGSMSPTFEVGDEVIYDKTSIEKVKVNDFIVFSYDFSQIDNLKSGNIITLHRVIGIEKIDDGAIRIITRGDNNNLNDKPYVTESNFIGIYNHKLSKFESFFVRNNFKSDIKVLSFLILGILSILFLDTLQFRKINFNK